MVKVDYMSGFMISDATVQRVGGGGHGWFGEY